MSTTLSFPLSFNNQVLKTTIITHESALDEALSSLLSKMNDVSSRMNDISSPTMSRVVGFGINKSFKSSANNHFVCEKVALLKLCYETDCLIVHLIHFASIPTCLAKFLDFSSLIFVGMRIKQDLFELHRDYGLRCRNAVDIGKLRGSVNRKPTSEFYDFVNMVYGAINLNKSSLPSLNSSLLPSELREKHCKLGFCEWDAISLSEDQIKQATLDAYGAFFVGKKYLSSQYW